jgi:DNA-binding NarL/FixJ family response regulator
LARQELRLFSGKEDRWATSVQRLVFLGARAQMRLLVISKFAIVRSALGHLVGSSTDVEVVGEMEPSLSVVEAIRTRRPEVVLLETGDSSDPELAQLIEQIAGFAEVRLVVLAGRGDVRAIRSMLRAGVIGYVMTQSSDTELLQALRSAARGHRFLDSSLIHAIATEESGPGEEALSRDGLSKRQMQVLKYLVHGYTSGEIARKLDVSVKTVETYRSRIYEKLEVRSRADLVKYAITTGLISMHEGMSD